MALQGATHGFLLILHTHTHINRLNTSSDFASRTGQLALNGQLCLVVLGAKNLPVRSDGTLNSFVKG